MSCHGSLNCTTSTTRHQPTCVSYGYILIAYALKAIPLFYLNICNDPEFKLLDPVADRPLTQILNSEFDSEC